MTLTIEDLTVRYPGGVTAVDGLSLEVAGGQLVALAGESGCGKSSLARALLGLLPESTTVTGSARLGQLELAGRTDWSGLRGATIAIIPQGAMSGLNPVQPVATQLAEMIRLHTSLRGPAAADRGRALLDRVRLAPRVLGAYPHELSGGMRQRVAIALALAGEPELIIADEPTTGLDAVTQEHILELLGEVRGRAGMLIISHDLSALVRIADRVAVMYAGRLAEVRLAHRLAEQAAHPYTIGLVTATASVEPSRPWGSVPGAAPSLDALPAGCRFAPRCPIAIDLCRTEEPPLLPHGAAQVACHRTGDPTAPAYPTVPAADRRSRPDQPATVGLRVTDVEQTYRTRRGAVRALCGVSLAIEPGQILGLVGESGSGKSTLARIILGLVRPAMGQVWVDGTELTGLRGRRLRAQQHRLGFVPQDPYSSLHPAMRVAGLVAEPLAVCRVPRSDRAGRLRSALAAAGLPTDADFLRRFPHQLSGGQRQRVALARALVNEPILLIADEATSMLDVSTRAGIATTLRSLATDRGLAVLFITHDLAEAVQSCDQIMVLREGVVVESGPPARLVGAPAHPYTTQLLAAAGHE